MPLGTPGYYGTNHDGTDAVEYCKFCYQNGVFTDPGMTLARMIESSVTYMTANHGFDETTAREMSARVITGLKRWKK